MLEFISDLFRKTLVHMYPFNHVHVGTNSKIMARYAGFGNLASTFLSRILHLKYCADFKVRPHQVILTRSWICYQFTYNSSSENNMEFTMLPKISQANFKYHY